MSRRNRLITWSGILLLSGMFLLGQQGWSPPLSRPAIIGEYASLNVLAYLYDVDENCDLTTTLLLTTYWDLELELAGFYGDDVDYAGARQAKRFRLTPEIELFAGRHFSLIFAHNYERLWVREGRLYAANLSEARAVYQFNTRSFVRAVLPGYAWVFPLGKGWYNVGCGVFHSSRRTAHVNLRRTFAAFTDVASVEAALTRFSSACIAFIIAAIWLTCISKASVFFAVASATRSAFE